MFKKSLCHFLVVCAFLAGNWAFPAPSLAAHPVKVGLISGYLTCWPGSNDYLDQFTHDMKKTGLVQEVVVVDPFLDADCLERYVPTVQELLQYDVVIMVEPPSEKAEEVGDLLADYYDAGGAVVTTRFYPLEGRWRTDGYNAYEFVDETDMLYTNEDPLMHHNQTMVKVDASHPILSGVDTVDGGPISNHAKVQLSPGAVDIARWTTSYPLLATKQTNGGKHHVALNFTPISNGMVNGLKIDGYGEPNYFNPGYRQDSDGAYLVANALQYAAFGEIYCSGCNDHDHCTAESCDPELGCQSEPIPGYCGCQALDISLRDHLVPFMTVRYEIESSCDACWLGCSFPRGCQQNIYSLYAVGSNEFLGAYAVSADLGLSDAIPAEPLALYTTDNGANWSTTPCSTQPGPVCTQNTDCEDADPCTIDTCDPEASMLATGCLHAPDPACASECVDVNAAVSVHEESGRATSEVTSDCSRCYYRCSFPSGCQQTITRFYATGSGDALGTDPNAQVSLYSEDDGDNWSTGDCSGAPVCTANEMGLCTDGLDNDCDGAADDEDTADCNCILSGSACSSDSDCCSGSCAGLWFNRTCE